MSVAMLDEVDVLFAEGCMSAGPLPLWDGPGGRVFGTGVEWLPAKGAIQIGGKDMSEETKRILEMLAQGKISVEDADRLMERMAGSRESSGFERAAGGVSGGEAGGDGESRRASRGPLKYLRVSVMSHNGDRVNVRLPLALVRAGVKLTTVLPTEVREKLDEKGVDLSQLSNLEGEELIEALRELNVDVFSKDGDKVRIFCE